MVTKDDKYNRICWSGEESKPTDETQSAHWKLYHDAMNLMKPNSVCLDVGCGFGGGSMILSRKCSKIMGIDVGKDAIDYANKFHKMPNIEYLETSIEDFPQDKKFDFICFIAVIEHLDSERLAIDKCYKMLNQDGIMMIYWCSANYNEDEIKNILKGYDYELTYETDLRSPYWWSIMRMI